MASKEKKAKKQIKKYYSEKKSDVVTKAATDTTRLQEDLQKVLSDAGIQTNRAIEDYIRNIGNIEANKAADVNELNDYVQTNTTRTQEDLDTSLAKETRRFSLEADQINQDLANKGLTFSDRTPEKVAKVGYQQNVSDINVGAERSFADIQRYEAAKNADIQLKYGQQTAETGVQKERTLEDILNQSQTQQTAIKRGTEDIAFGKATDIRDIGYDQNDAISNVENYYDSQKSSLKSSKELAKTLGF